MQRTSTVLLSVVACVCLGACSFSTGTSPGQAGVDLIDDELSEQSGLDYVDIDCEEPAEDEVGERFTCTARTADGPGPNDGALVNFVGVIEPDDMIFLAPANIIDASEISVVEAEAAEVLSAEVGVPISPDDVECLEETTVLVADQMSCVITDTANGDRYEMILTATEFELREGYGSRFYEIGELLTE